jgi:excisionase family DNA binding protein
MLSVAEAATELGISSPSLRRLIGHGLVPVGQIGGHGHRILIRKDDLVRLIAAKPKMPA